MNVRNILVSVLVWAVLGLSAAWANDTVMTIEKGLPVPFRFVQSLTSLNIKDGDRVPVEVTEDVTVTLPASEGGKPFLVFPKGMSGQARIGGGKAGVWGRPGYLYVNHIRLTGSR